jgi:hypothetical protein
MHDALQKVKWTERKSAAQLAAVYEYGGVRAADRASIRFKCISSNNDSSIIGRCLRGRDERNQKLVIGLNGVGTKQIPSGTVLDMIRRVGPLHQTLAPSAV